MAVRVKRTRRKGMDTLLKDAVRQTKRSSERWSRATIFWLALCDAAFRTDCCGVTWCSLRSHTSDAAQLQTPRTHASSQISNGLMPCTQSQEANAARQKSFKTQIYKAFSPLCEGKTRKFHDTQNRTGNPKVKITYLNHQW